MTPKEECEALMNNALPFAVYCLNKSGEFFPFGAVMKTDKTMNQTSVYDGDEQPESENVINNLINTHKKLASDGEIIASAVVYDSKITIDDHTEDAIVICLEHTDNYNVKIAFPYQIKKKLFKKEADVFEPIAIGESGDVF